MSHPPPPVVDGSSSQPSLPTLLVGVRSPIQTKTKKKNIKRSVCVLVRCLAWIGIVVGTLQLFCQSNRGILQLDFFTGVPYKDVDERILWWWLATPPDLLQQAAADNNSNSTGPSSTSRAPPLPLGQGSSPLAACLMFKDDTIHLHEWLAYHYTMFGLRYLLIGIDYDNSQNPYEVLELYNSSESSLQYWVWEPHQFASLRSKTPPNSTKYQAHRALVIRQKNFVTQCLQFYQQLRHNHSEVKWIALIDPDEFLVVQPPSTNSTSHPTWTNHDNNSSSRSGGVISQHFTMIDNRYNNKDSKAPFYASSYSLESSSTTVPCVTLPRLLIGSLDNSSCLAETQLSTLRYTQYGDKSKVEYSGYAKTILDVSKFKDTITGIRSIHRPIDACPRARVTVHQLQSQLSQHQQPFLYLNHYHGSWEQYASRLDDRRDYVQWIRRAHVQDGSIDCESMLQWVQAFERIGPALAIQALLSLNSTTKVNKGQ